MEPSLMSPTSQQHSSDIYVLLASGWKPFSYLYIAWIGDRLMLCIRYCVLFTGGRVSPMPWILCEHVYWYVAILLMLKSSLLSTYLLLACRRSPPLSAWPMLCFKTKSFKYGLMRYPAYPAGTYHGGAATIIIYDLYYTQLAKMDFEFSIISQLR